MISRRAFTYGLGVFSLTYSVASFSQEPLAPVTATNLSAKEKAKHEQFMRGAIEQAKKNKPYPFGAVIVNQETGEVVAEGVNVSSMNPIHHAEIVAITDFMERHGRADLKNMTLYTTGEPCAMCMGAIAWCGIPRVVWGSSIEKIRQSGIRQIDIGAVEVAKRAKEFYRPDSLIAGILASESDLLFDQRNHR
ncbi:nucleoside deaminase [Pseudomonas sp. 770NI]|uniref:nucleoside deaminase n=1 Tax=Pseudomonas sp. 770NI TaxID=2528664 RepID=UPI00192D7E7F|nr:nucleoside deaminase [Pseudomonas sp. 770NI]